MSDQDKQAMILDALHLLYRIYGYPEDLFPLWVLMIQNVSPAPSRGQAYVPTFGRNGDWMQSLGLTRATYYRSLNQLQQAGAIRPVSRTGWTLQDLTQKDWNWGYSFDHNHIITNIQIAVDWATSSMLIRLKGDDHTETTRMFPYSPYPFTERP